MSGAAIRESDRTSMDPILMSVLANRFETIVREMTNTLLRSGRSAVLAVARDFSCSIVTKDCELLASAEGAPVHVIGSEKLSEVMQEFHPDFAEGDAYLHNDPYLGNTHAADHTILVPVFVGGDHVFTACAKAHIADCGNSLPTTYMAFARDVYEEGALIFPCVRVQREYQDVEDIIRMCKRRIRVPEQWYGDYLAQLGAARIGELRVLELIRKYGLETIQAFTVEWFRYSEQKMKEAIAELPSGRFSGSTHYDAMPGVPAGIPMNIEIEIDAAGGRIELDLTKNPDNVPVGINQSETTAAAHATTGVLNSIDPDIPHNTGSLKRIRVHLREGCVAGIPRFPASCSVATTNVGDRLVNMTQAALATHADGFGAAEGGMGQGIGFAVISGTDWRRDGAPYINQMFLGTQGGGASAHADGWLTYLVPPSGGMLYKDSIEIDEMKYPILVKEARVLPDTGGAGTRRGAPGSRVVYGPRRDTMRVLAVGEGTESPPAGVRGGLPGSISSGAKIGTDGVETEVSNVGEVTVDPGEWIVGHEHGGGGYGDPLMRDPALVVRDVREHLVSRSAALDVYGVVLTDERGRGVEVDLKRTEGLRAERRQELGRGGRANVAQTRGKTTEEG